MDDQHLSRAISRILITQAILSGVIALTIIGAATTFAIMNMIKNTTHVIPSELTNWGGVIIGFYFGSSLSQMATLVQSLKDGNGRAKPPLKAGTPEPESAATDQVTG